MNNFIYKNSEIISFNSILLGKPIPKISYKDGYQSFYYLIENFDEAINVLQEFYKI